MRITKRLVAAAVAVMSLAGSIAAAEVNIELGKEYDLKAGEDFSGVITATSNGVLQQDGGPAGTYTDARGETVDVNFDGYGAHGQIWCLDVKKDAVYHVSMSPLDACKVVWLMNESGNTHIEVRNVEPRESYEVSTNVNGTGDVLVTFSVPVIYDTATLTVNGTTVDCENINVSYTTTPAIRVGDALRSLYAKKIIKAEGGDKFSIDIYGIRSRDGSLYTGDGHLSLVFLTAPKSVELVSTSMADGSRLYSYYPAGMKDGILTLTFDGEIASDGQYAPEATLTIGNIEVEGKHVVESVPVKVDGRTVTVDFTGVNRRVAIAAAGIESGTPWSFKLSNVHDTDHNLIESNSRGSVGSVDLWFIYTENEQRIVASEFLPESGASLRDTQEIEIWLNNFDCILSYSGVKFSYADGTSELIAAKDIVNESDETDEALWHIAVPQRAKTEPVTVEVADIVSNDGYTKVVKAYYNQFVVTYCSPFTEGATIDELPADEWMNANDPVRGNMTDEEWAQALIDHNAKKLVHIRTNYHTEYPDLYMTYTVTDVTAKEYIYGSYMTHLVDDEYVGAWFGFPYVLASGHAYAATFYAWANEEASQGDTNYRKVVGKFTITFYGAGEAFVYSPIKFVSVEPDPNMGRITPDQNVLIITYDGIVKIREDRSGVALGMGAGTVSFDEIEAVEADPENNGFASQWRLTIPRYMMSGTGVDVCVSAYDENGLVVEGDMGTNDEYDYKQFSYEIIDISSLAPVIVSPADGANVKVIDVITVKAEGAPLGINWNCFEPLTISDGAAFNHNVDREEEVVIDGEPVESADSDEPNLDENSLYVRITLKEAVTAPGLYTIHIPAEYFMIGSQFDVKNNAPADILVTVSGDGAVSIIDADTEGLYTVYTLGGVKVYVGNAEGISKLAKGIYVVNGVKTLIR